MRLARTVLRGARLYALVCVLAPAVAAADEGPPPAAQNDEPDPAELADAPLPGEESGRVDRVIDEDSTLRKVGRAAVVFPRFLIEVAFLPARGAAYAYDRFRLPVRRKSLVHNDEQTIGLSPTVRLDAGFGVTFGARFVHRDLFGKREHLSFRGARGGRFRELFGIDLRSGDRSSTLHAIRAGARRT